VAFRRKSPAQEGRQRAATPASRREFFSYHASRQAVDNQQAPVRRPAGTGMELKKHLTAPKIPIILGVAVIVVSLLYSTFLNSRPKFVISIGRNQKLLRPTTTYETAGQTILQQSLLSHTKLTVNSKKISEEIEQRFPELQEVTVALPLVGHRPVIHAVAEQPALIITSPKGGYVLGMNGVVLAKASHVRVGDFNLPTVEDESGLEIEVGKGALSSSDVIFITTLIKQFDAQHLPISSLKLPALASELRVQATGIPYYIKFSLLSDPRLAAGQYFALKKRLDAEKVTPSEYVDSRVEERIYYK
jgi:hypothetical protein